MSEENNENHWDRYLGKVVMVQLRHQPYIGVTGEDMQPAVSEDGFMNTPLIRGTVKEVSGTRLVLETTDPNPSLGSNKVFIDLDAERDVGYLTTVERSLVSVAS